MVVVLAAAGCAHRQAAPVTAAELVPPEPGAVERGEASWYGHPYHGRRTASGERYDMHQLTAAHRTLAFDTWVVVTRRDDGRSVEVRINDRGPFIAGRIIDLSWAAARRIGLDADGVAPVSVEVVGRRRRAEAPPPVPADEAEVAVPACWWVQVGAFGDPANARRATARLEAAGERAVIVEGPGGLERVRVGPFDGERAVEKALERIRSDWPEAVLVSCG
ncbi:MAG TPA: septal ring lytic transglycosylase RlpA family protein [Thermoanaerobaculales bacterium]|nr:septal ring lytic transglycosylase RlpA family protein [Thermoanaerobaculales bacterium]HPA79223.1 septal ring lytic transglycosylase RlpA family protein [Thermoanaerobaculales bacterium]HQL28731.1 septal ring lytic transglycosylase RlpA family protein [Thermoanaerobaculales bacterium]HQN97280.1 septal ring lytic transglycosylase RlpA family protein [Thermoanaerobaculales bacterium]HQP42763.1 septal ring lytic transglycosylase RlpA family protein [Thermoanaerobaculales bacterium]